MSKLTDLQNELKAPKNQFNSFGKYKYRSCEDILEAVKPLLKKYDLTLTITDIEPKQLIDVIYLGASAVLTENGTVVASNQAFAGIEIDKKGMDMAQTFGTSSSYARKYALNGLFLIDDTKDSDTDEHKTETQAKAQNSRTNEVKQQPKANTPPQQQNATQCENKPSISPEDLAMRLNVASSYEVKVGKYKANPVKLGNIYKSDKKFIDDYIQNKRAGAKFTDDEEMFVTKALELTELLNVWNQMKGAN